MSVYGCTLSQAADPGSVGGKAHSLWRMKQLGLPVPDGFVIASAAFDAFLAEDGQGERIARRREGLRAGALEGLREASREIQAWVHAAPLPAAVREDLHALRAATLPGAELIVRSSAVGEDSAAASFAGQLDSILHVHTEEELERALRACWASYWSERSLGYQLQRGIALGGMGVVVQRLVPSRVSGVLFTRAPGGQPARGAMLAEYCHGHGEALVSGRINPGRFTLAREGAGWTREAEPEQDGADPEAEALLFAPARLAALRDGGLALEQRLGAPQDIEWTIDGEGQLHFVQSRPITTAVEAGAPVPAPAEGPPAPRRPILWSNANINENYPDPVSPLLHSIAATSYYHYFRNLAFAVGITADRVERLEYPLRNIIGAHGARLYYNLSNIYAFLRIAPFGDVLTGYFDHFIGAEIVAEPGAEVPAKRGADLAELVRIFLTTTRTYVGLEGKIRAFEETVDAFCRRTEPPELPARSTVALLADLRGFLEIRFHHWTNASLADCAAMITFGALKQFLERALPEPEERALHGTLLKGMPGLVSSQPVERLWELSRAVVADPALKALFAAERGEALLAGVRGGAFPEFARAFDAYLRDWGFRGSGELMLTVPSFAEQPAELLELLKGYIGLDGPSPAELLAQQRAERDATMTRILARLGNSPLLPFAPFPRRADFFRLAVSWTQKAIAFRERARLKQALLYTRLRRILLAIGDRLVAEGRFAERDDVFFLTYPELESLLAGGSMFPGGAKALVTLRRRQHEEVSRLQPPDRFTLDEGRFLEVPADGAPPPSPERAEAGEALTGVGTCGGKVTAPATVMRELAEFDRLKAGDILVTRQTDPGWAPVFFLIKGLVMERGGMLSHGSIIAREFGIPALVGVRNATQRIAQGQRIALDGDLGTVRPVE